jgi:hypothetical protein
MQEFDASVGFNVRFRSFQLHESSSSAMVPPFLSKTHSSISVLCLNYVGSITQQRVGEKRRIKVLDWSSNQIAVHGSNEFQRDRSGPRGEQFEDQSLSFVPRDLHS